MNKLLIKNNFTSDEAERLTQLLSPTVREYKKGDIIMSIYSNICDVGIVLKGMVFMTSISTQGCKSIIDICGEGCAFGGEISFAVDFNAYYAQAKASCRVAHIEYERFVECCKGSSRLTDCFLGGTLKRQQTHIDILTQRSIRQKLVLYFNCLCRQQGGRNIRLPVSMSDLADYICVDRSAMTREIKKLCEQGVIASDGKSITLL